MTKVLKAGFGQSCLPKIQGYSENRVGYTLFYCRRLLIRHVWISCLYAIGQHGENVVSYCTDKIKLVLDSYSKVEDVSPLLWKIIIDISERLQLFLTINENEGEGIEMFVQRLREICYQCVPLLRRQLIYEYPLFLLHWRETTVSGVVLRSLQDGYSVSKKSCLNSPSRIWSGCKSKIEEELENDECTMDSISDEQIILTFQDYILSSESKFYPNDLYIHLFKYSCIKLMKYSQGISVLRAIDQSFDSLKLHELELRQRRFIQLVITNEDPAEEIKSIQQKQEDLEIIQSTTLSLIELYRDDVHSLIILLFGCYYPPNHIESALQTTAHTTTVTYHTAAVESGLKTPMKNDELCTPMFKFFSVGVVDVLINKIFNGRIIDVKIWFLIFLVLLLRSTPYQPSNQVVRSLDLIKSKRRSLGCNKTSNALGLIYIIIKFLYEPIEWIKREALKLQDGPQSTPLEISPLAMKLASIVDDSASDLNVPAIMQMGINVLYRSA